MLRLLEYFKFSHEETESGVLERDASYKGASFEALYTSSEDYIEIFKSPWAQKSFLDLGCGTGLGCLIHGELFPDQKSIGIEFELSRLNVGKKYLKEYPQENTKLIHADLLSFKIPKSEAYFLYFPTGPVLDRVLSQLLTSEETFVFIAIESHGDLYSRLELETSLNLVQKIPLTSLRHNSHAHIYLKKGIKKRDLLDPFELSFKEKFLLLEDSRGEWIGESLGLTWHQGEEFNLLTPPRTISRSSIREVLELTDLPESLQSLLLLRRSGDVRIITTQNEFQGRIRKVYRAPSYFLELSTGELIYLDDILSIKGEE